MTDSPVIAGFLTRPPQPIRHCASNVPVIVITRTLFRFVDLPYDLGARLLSPASPSASSPGHQGALAFALASATRTRLRRLRFR